MKFILTNNIKIVNGHTLYQICAIENKGLVRAGELGGFIEHVENLSQKGLCWITEDSAVLGCSRINGDVRIVNSTIIDTNVFGDSYIIDSRLKNSIVHDSHISKTRVIKSHLMNVRCFGEKPATLYDCRLENTTLAGSFKFKDVEIEAPCSFTGPIYMSNRRINIPVILYAADTLYINSEWTIDVHYRADCCTVRFTDKDTNRTIHKKVTKIDYDTWS